MNNHYFVEVDGHKLQDEKGNSLRFDSKDAAITYADDYVKDASGYKKVRIVNIQ